MRLVGDNQVTITNRCLYAPCTEVMQLVHLILNGRLWFQLILIVFLASPFFFSFTMLHFFMFIDLCICLGFYHLWVRNQNPGIRSNRTKSLYIPNVCPQDNFRQKESTRFPTRWTSEFQTQNIHHPWLIRHPLSSLVQNCPFPSPLISTYVYWLIPHFISN